MADKDESEKEHESDPEQGSETSSEEEHHHESELDDDECDEAIAGLLDSIGQLEARNAELEQRIASLESQLGEHHTKFKHEPVPEPAATESEPEPRHWYFKRVGKQ